MNAYPAMLSGCRQQVQGFSCAPSHGAMPANRCLYMHAISSLCLSIAVIMTSSCAARNLIYIIYSQNDQLYAAL
jgi:hypothetical protein